MKDAPEPREKELAAALDDMLFSSGALNVKLLGEVGATLLLVWLCRSIVLDY